MKNKTFATALVILFSFCCVSGLSAHQDAEASMPVVKSLWNKDGKSVLIAVFVAPRNAMIAEDILEELLSGMLRSGFNGEKNLDLVGETTMADVIILIYPEGYAELSPHGAYLLFPLKKYFFDVTEIDFRSPADLGRRALTRIDLALFLSYHLAKQK